MADLSLPKPFAKRDYHVIDERVKPLVDAMNSTGLLETIASCQGHVQHGQSPYVYFKTNAEFAAIIERRLREYYASDRLNDFWTLQGMFNKKYQLCFLLRAPQHEERSESVIRSFFNFSDFFRLQLDQDFETLTGLFRESMSHKP